MDLLRTKGLWIHSVRYGYVFGALESAGNMPARRPISSTGLLCGSPGPVEHWDLAGSAVHFYLGCLIDSGAKLTAATAGINQMILHRLAECFEDCWISLLSETKDSVASCTP